jgi:hypothetical protein
MTVFAASPAACNAGVLDPRSSGSARGASRFRAVAAHDRDGGPRVIAAGEAPTSYVAEGPR